VDMAGRFEKIANLLSYYGYEVRHTAGQEDGRDWEVTYCLRAGMSPPIKTVASPTEEGLIEYLRTHLPDEAVRDWRGYAFTLEGEIARMKRGG
jgi:hypothetical protein